MTTNTVEIHLPDIGDTDGVEVVEVLVHKGQFLEKDQSIVLLEGSKASMEIPSDATGKVSEIHVEAGQSVEEKMLLVTLATEDAPSTSSQVESAPTNDQPSQGAPTKTKELSDESQKPSKQMNPSDASGSKMIIFNLPDIGDTDGVEVVEIMVKVGDQVQKDNSLLTLEGSKASMEIPSEHEGEIKKILVKVGDAVSEKMPLFEIEVAGGSSQASEDSGSSESKQETELAIPSNSTDTSQNESEKQSTSETRSSPSNTTNHNPPTKSKAGVQPHASPSVRKFARSLGVRLEQVSASGRKDRILKEDIEKYVKHQLTRQLTNTGGASSYQMGITPLPEIDFAKFGPIEHKKLSKIKTISAKHLHTCWLNIPHVTQFGEANIEPMERYRQSLKEQFMKEKLKLTPLVFIMKAVVASLKAYENFNASLSGDSLVLKRYYHIGIAVDTPNGLVVPVIRDVDQKTIRALCRELADISQKARSGKLLPSDLSGGTFSISSLGGIGGTQFTPIVNGPEGSYPGSFPLANQASISKRLFQSATHPTLIVVL